MNYAEYNPTVKLQNIVQKYFVFEIEENEQLKLPIQHETIPDSNVSIVIIKQPYFEGIRIIGPHTQKYQQEIYPYALFFGITLLPWLSFEPDIINKEKLFNQTAEVPKIINRHLREIKIEQLNVQNFKPKLIEKPLLNLCKYLKIGESELVKYICLQLLKGTPINKVVNSIPISTRVIQKRFKSITGLTMRQYLSNSRLRSVWNDIVENRGSKMDLLHKYHFYDQAHFINDFKKKMQRSPSDFKSYLDLIKIDLT